MRSGSPKADALAAEISFSGLLELAEKFGSSEEQWAVREFKERVPFDTLITATHALEINHDALQKVTDLTEVSSAQRNATMALEYPLVLSSLARRLVWRSRRAQTQASEVIGQCAGQDIREVVRGANTTP